MIDERRPGAATLRWEVRQMAQSTGVPKRNNAYELFILVLTVFSLIVMMLLLLPFSPATLELLRVYDNFICVVFLGDFSLNLFQAPTKREYFFGRRGWLDLLGSIPSLGIFRLTGLLRLFRLSRLARILRLLRGSAKKEIVEDVIRNSGQYAAFVTVMLTFLVLTIASTLVLQFDSTSPDANITTGGDALWWAIVTITTVGYGDKYPVSMGGRITAVFVMFAGVGIIGALASILSGVLLTPQAADSNGEPVAQPTPVTDDQLAALRGELAAIRRISRATGESLSKSPRLGKLVSLDEVDGLLGDTPPKRQPHPDVSWEVNAGPDA